MKFPYAKLLALTVTTVSIAFVAGVLCSKYVPTGEISRYVARFVGHHTENKTTETTLDDRNVDFSRYLETSLLPLLVQGKRLSDSYAVPKSGGAITIAGAGIIILDRLGGLHRYDLKTATFSPLKAPPLPNNLDSFSQTGAEINEYNFRAHGIIYLKNRQELAVAYDKFDRQLNKLQTAVSLLPFDPVAGTATGEWQDIFTSDPYAPGAASSSGGRMAYRGDDQLYLTLGDHYITTPPVSQDPSTTFGKIIDIDLSTKQYHIVSIGHRNPQGLAFLSSSNELLSTEQGPKGGDELNIIKEASNYGWPIVTLGTKYATYNWNGAESNVGRLDGYSVPLFAWVPSIAVSQLIEVENFNSRWNGDLLVASLKASSLYRLRLDHGRVLYSEPIWIGQRIRDIAQLGDGKIVLWTDDTQLLFINVDEDLLKQGWRAPNIVSATLGNHCMYCHHLGPTHPGDPAPSLSNVIGRPIASDNFPYSEGLRGVRGVWTADALSRFLADPGKFASGTNMPDLRLSPETIKKVVTDLNFAEPQQATTVSSRAH